MLRLHLTGILLCIWTLTSIAQIDEQKLRTDASNLFEESSFAAAYPLYAQLVSLSPKDPELNFKFGTCALYTGEEKSNAIKHLTFAVSRGAEDPRVYYYLGKAYHLNYEFDLAKKAYGEYLKKVSPKEKNILDAELGISMCSQGQNLLTNIQEIVVLEKTNSETESFFRYYNLEEIGGKVLTTPEVLLTKYDQKIGHRGVIHFQPNSGAVYFSSYGKDGSSGKDLYKAFVLPDGKFSTPEKLSNVINTKFDEDFAFLHPDGVSFYFSSKGHNSMGGYDVFKSTVDPITGEFTAPENLDFAINTPDDDIFYVVDSLHQNAYFASSRSSSQNEMHVYKVMVQGIPMQLLFVKGLFDNLITEDQTVANLEIYDELTGRPIASVSTNAADGNYLISFPKAGLYRYKVVQEGSQLIHEGIVEIPIFDKPVALGQELQIVDENGLEKLVIINHFEEPLEEDLAALSAALLRQKAGLDVNADEELIAEANELANPTVELAKAHLLAGFTDAEKPEVLAAELEAEASERKDLAKSLRNQAAMGMETARDAHELSNQYMEEAVSSIRDKSPENTPNYLELLESYNALINKSSDQRLLASNALQATQKLIDEADAQEQRSQELATRSQNIDSLYQSDSADQLVEVLTEERNRRLIGEDKVSFDLKQSDISLADVIENQLIKQGDRLSNLRTEEVQLDRDINLKAGAISNTKKKKELEVLNAELKDLQASLRLTREEIDKVDQQIATLAKDEQALRTSAELYEIFEEMEASRPGGRVAPDLQAMKDLEGMVEHNGEILSMLSRSEELVVAEASEEMIATRNDIKILPGVQQKADELDIVLKQASTQEEEYKLALKSLDETEVGKDVKANLLAKQNVEIAKEQLNVLRATKSNNSQESAQIESEIETWENLLTNFKKDAATAENNPLAFEPVDETQALEIIKAFNPATAENYEKTQHAMEAELTVMSDRYDWSNSMRKALKGQIKANESAMLASDDQAELESLATETKNYMAALDWVNRDAVSVADLQMAYESDKKAIMESDRIYEDKLEEQIRLTEEFLAQTTEMKTNPFYQKDKSQLELMANQANSKLESYQSDLDLTLNASSETIDENSVNPQVDSIDNELKALAETTDILAIPEVNSEKDIYAAIAPQYLTQKQAIEEMVTEEQLLEQTAQLSALDQQMVVILKNQTDLRVSEMDQTTDPEVKDLLQQEVQQLQLAIESLEGSNSEVSNTTLADSIANDNSVIEETEVIESETVETVETDTPENTTTTVHPIELIPAENLMTKNQLEDVTTFEGYPESISSEQQTAWSELLKVKKYSDETQLSDFGSVSMVMVTMDDVDDFTEDLDLVEAKTEEIEMLSIEQQLEEKRSKQKKLEKQIEKAYYNKAEAEIRNSKRIATSADVLYEAQEKELDKLLVDHQEDIANNPWLKSYLFELIKESKEKSEQADEIRQTVAPEIDEIKQAFGMNRAAQFDLEATESNQKAIDVLTQAKDFAELDQEVLAALFNNIPVESRFVTEAETAPEESTDDNVITYKFILPEAYINTEQTSTTSFKENLMADYSVPNEYAEAVLQSPQFENVSALLEKRDETENLLRKNIEGYNEIITEAAELNERAQLLETAITSAESKAEAEGLEVERQSVLEDLEVLVGTLNQKSQDISQLSEDLNVQNDEVALALSDIDLEETLEEIEEAVVAEVPVETEVVETVESMDSAETVVDTESSEPLERTVEIESPVTPEVISASESRFKSSDVQYNFATNNNFANYIDSYPTELKEEVFAVTKESIYSESQPVPLNLEMPAGIIYKVQVGAFRNPIAAETFGKFAPLSGEQLNNGITRYTAGLFKQFDSADEAKKVIREMGYSDAFVVAFENGKRIPLYAAKEVLAATQTAVVSSTADTSAANVTDQSRVEGSDSETAEAQIPAPTPITSVTVEESAKVEATDWATQSGVFFTVQIGVFSKQVSKADLYNAENVYSERVANGQVRYTSGRFESIDQARTWKDQMVDQGIPDAFISAYQNGNRITIAQALGNEPIIVESTPEPEQPQEKLFYQVVIGVYSSEVPSKTAMAMLSLENRWGIVQQPTSDGTMYVTKLVSSMDVVEMIQKEFKNQGVQVLEAITYKNGERMGSQPLGND